MIELLILYELNKKVLTMYGISKEIKNNFAVLTLPSFGTIKPALIRLQNSGFIKSQKIMSEGGRPSIYYSITKDGFDELKKLLLEPPLENPIKFLTVTRIKLFCANILDMESQKELFNILKNRSELIMIETKNILESNTLDFYQRMVFDNLICEYKNLLSLLEGLKNVCKN